MNDIHERTQSSLAVKPRIISLQPRIISLQFATYVLQLLHLCCTRLARSYHVGLVFVAKLGQGQVQDVQLFAPLCRGGNGTAS